MERVETIARGLTEAQREFLSALPLDCSWRGTGPEIRMIGLKHGANSLRGFGASDFVEGYYRDEVRHRLTPLGQQVATYIKEQGDG